MAVDAKQQNSRHSRNTYGVFLKLPSSERNLANLGGGLSPGRQRRQESGHGPYPRQVCLVCMQMGDSGTRDSGKWASLEGSSGVVRSLVSNGLGQANSLGQASGLVEANGLGHVPGPWVMGHGLWAWTMGYGSA